ncbi:MAG: phosphoribosylglycinamide formyltransferase [Polynucleobacter sp.]|jgi:phosphoribosylglycinamide formyltransferase-1|nr:phosphoribosylglycinamide formyltransferase [Polynucleobacter sp.]
MHSIVSLISGRGSNLQALVKAAQNEAWQARFVAVISNQPDAKGLDFARQNGIPAIVVNHRDFASREAFDEALAKTIDSFSPDLIALAGFMRVLTDPFIDRYQGRMINIHPSLLPHFPGLHTHERALEAGVKKHGASVHFVTRVVDEGPIICQGEVPVLPNDDADTLAARVLKMEHRIYPLAVKWFINGRLHQEGSQVQISPPESQYIVQA